jgi:hypothetical protein
MVGFMFDDQLHDDVSFLITRETRLCLAHQRSQRIADEWDHRRNPLLLSVLSVLLFNHHSVWVKRWGSRVKMFYPFQVVICCELLT